MNRIFRMWEQPKNESGNQENRKGTGEGDRRQGTGDRKKLRISRMGFLGPTNDQRLTTNDFPPTINHEPPTINPAD
jgi:hypothetical protein